MLKIIENGCKLFFKMRNILTEIRKLRRKEINNPA